MTFELSPERINFIKVSLKRPLLFSIFFLRGIRYLFAALWRKAIRYFRKKNWLNRLMRVSVIGDIPTSCQSDYECKLVLSRLPEINFSPQPYCDFSDIKLANETIKATDLINWSCDFHDQEDVFALNRFGWLLDAILSNPSIILAEKTLRWMQDWIDVMGDNKTHLAWKSYSVAERLSNWPFILRIVEKLIPIPDAMINKFEEAIIFHINHLLYHIEARGTSTNNHILNDARGLYIGAVVMGDLITSDKAREIFYEWTEKLVGPDGMLKEHSSHYQFLICQRYEQVLFAASHVGDSDFREFMDTWLERMRQARDFFSVLGTDGRWSIPLIGDISPDFTPQWLSSNPATGWSRLKKWFDKPPPVPSSRHNKQLMIFDDSFIRYDIGEVTIFWHVEAENTNCLNHHGHYDLGSFILFYKGQQVFADNGLRSYLDVDSFGKLFSAHSTVTIDSLGAYCQNRWINKLRGYHKQQRAQYEILKSDNQLEIRIKTDGFSRLVTPAMWERDFIVTDNSLTIIDNIESTNINHIKASFQLDPQVDVIARDSEIVILSGGNRIMSLKADKAHFCRFSVINGGGTDSPQGWCSKEYGSRLPGTVVTHQYQLDRAQTTTYEIRWQDE